MTTSRTDNFTIQAGGQLVECRFVYPYLAKKRDKDWQNKPVEPKDQWFEVTILIPKRADDLLAAPYLGPAQLVQKVWEAWCGQPGVNGQWKQGAGWPILDCDVVNAPRGGGRVETEPFAAKNQWAKGCWRINASSNYPCRVVGPDNADVPKDQYGEFLAFKGGDYGNASVHCWAYSTGTGGVSFGLEGVRKSRDGEPIGVAQRSPEQMFGAPAVAANAPPLPPGFQPGAYGGGVVAPSSPPPAYQVAPPAGAPSPAPGYAPSPPPSPPQPVWNGTQWILPPASQGGPPQPGFSAGGAAPLSGYPANGPAAPFTNGAAPGPATPYPSSGAPVYGGAPAGGMPPPPPFGTR